MTREQAKTNLVSMGVSEPTPEQIDYYLNSFSGEIKREKDLAEKYKADALKAKDYETQIEEMKNKGLSEIDLAKKDTEKANSRVAELEKQIMVMQRKGALAEKGIVGEIAEKLFKDDGTMDIDVLGQIITDRETKAKSLAEKELLEKTPNPKGSDKNDDNGNNDDAFVKSIVANMASTSKGADDIVKSYL